MRTANSADIVQPMIIGHVKRIHGNGDGDGYGNGYGNGYGDGDGNGDGYGNGNGVIL